MIPVIIFEGPDRAGKTTIANAVAKEFGVEVFMSNSKEAFASGIFGSDSSSIALFNYMIADYAREASKIENMKPIIIYRSFMSEIVYSELLGRKTSTYHNMSADLIFSEIDATIILCTNNKKDNFNDEHLTDNMINISVELYKNSIDLVETDILQIDTTEQKVDEYVKQIMEYVNGKQHNN